jgi:SpoVK/Ycf46/Vps4 family AAA+-type ATPase
MSLAVASMANAMVINMSPNQLNSYIDKPVEATKLVHMIFSVAMDPSYAPVVILIDECEKIFAKKKKGQSSGLTIFLKDLLTYKNQALTKQDRVIIIGCTSSPELADISILKWKGNMGKPYKQGKILHHHYFKLQQSQFHFKMFYVLKDSLSAFCIFLHQIMTRDAVFGVITSSIKHRTT